MPGDELATASELLESAANDTENAAASERLSELAGQLGQLSADDSGADHGRLARIQSALNELSDGDGADAAETIAAANDAINEYRSDLEGV